MAQLFLIHTLDDPAAATAGAALAAVGYAIWTPPNAFDPQSISYARAVETGIQRSAAVVLVWSVSAAQSADVERRLLYAQQLLKPIAVLRTDAAALPPTLVDAPAVDMDDGHPAELLLPHLPPPEDDDLLLALLTGTIRERKEGIRQAAEAIARGERRDELTAQLADMARNDLMPGVQEAAQRVVDSQTTAPTSASDAHHIFKVRCAKGHFTYFDKRNVCVPDGTIPRARVERAGQALDQLLLTCGTPGCGDQVTVRVSCEGYR